MPANQNKKLEKKRKIIESAYQIVKSKNIYNTAVDDIVKSAGIARGTFYLYFKDKSDLIEQLIFLKSSESMKVLLKKFEERMSDSDDIFELSREFIGLFIDFLIEQKEALAVLTKNISSCLRDFPRFYDDEVENIYSGIIQRFVQLGLSEDDINKKIYLAVDMVGSVCSDAILFGKPYGINEIRRPLTDAAIAILMSGTALTSGGSDE
ncbi:MAG: TetR/AcrR family transcriptional regulator [Oscillospiraceae bacterium]|nr:TetR/AcrR family transcriptional regulator [Oscillospiraceae bacterium]